MRAGLCEDSELWEYTHAVYGLRESPRWWGEFRDSRLAQLNVIVGSRRIKLLQCRVEGSWWRLVDESTLVGIVVVYVDDLLICSIPTIVIAVSEAIKKLWDTSSLAWASDGIRFLGIEIAKIQDGFALSQESYIRELLRVHEISATQKDLIPVTRDQARFEAETEETVFTTEELRKAQQLAGEVLWLSQRTRPDIAYTASLVSSLCARAPRRAVVVARKCIGYLQRTIDYTLEISTKERQIVAWTDASFAPEGARSHSGWIIQLGEAPVSWRSSRQTCVTLSTAESELYASVEGALALVSIEALLRELDDMSWSSILRTDSTSSWRTRHLRIKSNWVSERLERGDLQLEHWPGDVKKSRCVDEGIILDPIEGIKPADWTGTDFRSCISCNKHNIAATAPSAQGFKVLIALLVLSQSVGTSDATGMTVYEPMTVDHTLVMWCVFAVIALLWTLAWELIKYAGWQLYFSATPGASGRRLRRLQRIRDTTAEAIQQELDVRRRTVDQRAARINETGQARETGRRLNQSNRLHGRAASSARGPETPLGTERTIYREGLRDRAVQTTGPNFAPTVPEVRTEIRREVQIPEWVHIVPGNQCFHLCNPCYAFRHRGTQDKVQTLRICEYYVRHQGRNPQDHGPSLDDILRLGQIPNFDRPGINPG